MNLFEFVTVMISVILALAVAQLFLGLAPLLQTRHEVRFSTAHAAWVGTLFLIPFLYWWSLWDFRDLEWTFPMFAVSLVGPSLMFFAATLINPHDTLSGPIDLSSHYRDIRRPFLIVMFFATVCLTIDGPLFGTEAPFNRLRFAQLLSAGLAGMGVFSQGDRTHTVIGLLTFALAILAATTRMLPGVVL